MSYDVRVPPSILGCDDFTINIPQPQPSISNSGLVLLALSVIAGWEIGWALVRKVGR